ncbi:MAG: quinone oxidoreductase [Deltaproteobacteria bacterium]
MTRAIRFDGHGGPEVLRLVEVDLPQPGEGEALVRHTAIGVNYIDTYHRSGLYPKPLPAGLGVEAAGVVEALGPGVAGVAVGTRVAYVGGSGASYSDAAVVPAAGLVALPDSITDQTAAGMMLKGLTVEMLLERIGKLSRGDTILLHAASGGVGLIACAWARHLGVITIGTVGSAAKAELAAAAGCTHTVLYRDENFVERVREITAGAGVKVVYDSVGKDVFEDSLDCLEPRGLLATFGNASGQPPAVAPATLAAKGSLFVTRPTLFAYIADPEELRLAAARLFELVTGDILPIDVRHRYPLAEAAQAHRDLEGRRTSGSIILVP